MSYTWEKKEKNSARLMFFGKNVIIITAYKGSLNLGAYWIRRGFEMAEAASRGPGPVNNWNGY